MEGEFRVKDAFFLKKNTFKPINKVIIVNQIMENLTHISFIKIIII